MKESLLGARELGRIVWRQHVSGPWKWGHLALVLFAVVLALMPLFNLLGYEFSMMIGVAATFVVGPLTLRSLAPPASAEAQIPAQIPAHAERPSVGESFLIVTGHNLLLLVGPLVVIVLNSVRVQVCDWSGGFALYGIMAGISTIQATLAAFLADAATGGRRGWRHAAYFGMVIASIVGALAYLALEPPIVTVNPFIGYFAGSIYDEALAIPPPLLSYRLLQLALIGGIVCALELIERKRLKRTQPQQPPRAGSRWLWVGVLGAALVVCSGLSGPKQFSLNTADIQEALGARYETEHFIIYYSASGDWGQRIERIAEDHEFRYWQLKKWFNEDPVANTHKKLISYIYPNREEKGRLMGARNTLVAKLWLGDMHIVYERYGSSIVKHEMAHLFTAPFGTGLLKLATPGLLVPNMGLVEGVAAAAEWGIEGGYSPHGASAALHRLELAPDMTRVLGAQGFWSQNSRTVYTLYGSFVRWLVETKGIDPFKQVYGSSDFEAVYNTPLPTLIEAWKTFLLTIPLTDSELEVMRERFDRPSIFGKTCARHIAERRRIIGQLAASGQHDAAANEAETICRLDPDNPQNLVDLQHHLTAAKRFVEAEATNRRVLDHPKTSKALRASALEDQADLRWQVGAWEEAAAIYKTLLSDAALSPDQRRALTIKSIAVTNNQLQIPIASYFFDDASPMQKLALLYEARRAYPSQPIFAYLLGLRLSEAEAHEEAYHHLLAAVSLDLPAGEIAERAQFLLAYSAYFTDRLPEAHAHFTELSQTASRDGDRTLALDWVERAQWRAESPR